MGLSLSLSLFLSRLLTVRPPDGFSVVEVVLPLTSLISWDCLDLGLNLCLGELNKDERPPFPVGVGATTELICLLLFTSLTLISGLGVVVVVVVVVRVLDGVLTRLKNFDLS